MNIEIHYLNGVLAAQAALFTLNWVHWVGEAIILKNDVPAKVGVMFITSWALVGALWN